VSERGPLLVVCDGMGGVEGGETRLRARRPGDVARDEADAGDPGYPRCSPACCAAPSGSRTTMSTPWRAASPACAVWGRRCRRPAWVSDRLIVATCRRLAGLRAALGRARAGHARPVAATALLAAGHSENEAGERGGGRSCRRSASAPMSSHRSLVIALRRGDRVLLCSDGLHGLVGDPALALLLSEPHNRSPRPSSC